MPELGVEYCPDVLDPTSNRTYAFLVDILSEIVGAFSDPLLFLGGDEVNEDFTIGYKCFDKDAKVHIIGHARINYVCKYQSCMVNGLRGAKVSAWLKAHGMTSRALLDHFWRRCVAI